jgi:hypothetical protein
MSVIFSELGLKIHVIYQTRMFKGCLKYVTQRVAKKLVSDCRLKDYSLFIISVGSLYIMRSWQYAVIRRYRRASRVNGDSYEYVMFGRNGVDYDYGRSSEMWLTHSPTS